MIKCDFNLKWLYLCWLGVFAGSRVQLCLPEGAYLNSAPKWDGSHDIEQCAGRMHDCCASSMHGLV